MLLSFSNKNGLVMTREQPPPQDGSTISTQGIIQSLLGVEQGVTLVSLSKNHRILLF